ncbi:hypothetical protein HY029_00225 [Candidatus Gottesmanbacteria bacterium]|nr:hypothetical protein [Candidatus Gottesmanbacteria bacterium]
MSNDIYIADICLCVGSLLQESIARKYLAQSCIFVRFIGSGINSGIYSVIYFGGIAVIYIDGVPEVSNGCFIYGGWAGGMV